MGKTFDPTADRYLDQKDISEMLNINRNAAYELMKRAECPTIRPTPRRMVVLQSAFLKWLEAQATKDA